MEEFKEFQGKSLDEAIRGACSYFNTPREKLEIDIVQDAKNGIFGLVGARKAVIRARRTQLKSKVDALLGRESPIAPSPSKKKSVSERSVAPGASPEAAPEQGRGAVSKKTVKRNVRPSPVEEPRLSACASEDEDVKGNRLLPEAEDDDSLGNRLADPPDYQTAYRLRGHEGYQPQYPGEHLWNTNRVQPRSRVEKTRQDRTGRSFLNPQPKAIRPDQTRKTVHNPAPDDRSPTSELIADTDDTLAEGLPAIPFSELDHEKLMSITQEVAATIVSAILGETPIVVTALENRMDVRVECGEDSGLLIGREGQTLAALQYVTSRIVSRRMEAPVRVQFDVGDYRERQDERLRELALALAERVRSTGRPCSTRPMSSYHRRLIHMTLQDAPDVQTRSSGEGPLKRVIIQRRRTGV